MREIKFRAWDALADGMFGIDDRPQEFWSKVHPASCDVYVMQYTGLKDKNGVEIYEGDIVKTVFDLAKRKRHIGEIYFQPTRLNWSVKHSVFANQDLFVYTRPDRSIEVIGNIYENPELLL